MKRLNWLPLLILFIVPLVSANIAMPFSERIVYLLPLVIVIETICFYLLSNKSFNIKIGVGKSFIIITLANILTSAFGTFMPIHIFAPFALIIAFILSVIIEFLVYLMLFFKEDVKKKSLFSISLTTNIISYIFLFLTIIIFK